jgi:hypothetical protein
MPVIDSDAALGLEDAGNLATEPDDTKFVACGTGTTPRYRAIYARLWNSPETEATVKARIRASLRQASAFVTSQARDDGATAETASRLRFACSGSEIEVRTVTVSATSAPGGAIDFQDLDAAVASQRSPGVRLVAYFDGDNTQGAAGQGYLYNDARADPSNNNNRTDSFAAQYYTDAGGPYWDVFLHEMLHNMGATQDAAPGSNGLGHCTDDADVMCYDEPGAPTTPGVCATTQLDCGGDTYFNAGCPAAGSWLATHWNAGSPNNLWLDHGTRTQASLLPSTPGAPSATATTSTTATLAWAPATDDCPSLQYRVYVRIPGRNLTIRDAGSATTLTADGLTADGPAYFSVVAVDGAGNQSPRTAETPVQLPAPTIRSAAPNGPTITGVGTLTRPSAQVTWRHDGTGEGAGAVTAWRIDVIDEASHAKRSVTVSDPGTFSARIPLTGGTPSTVTVAAISEMGPSTSPSIRVVGSLAAGTCTWKLGDRTAPTKPRGLALSKRLVGKLAVKWKGSTDANGVCAYLRLRKVGAKWVPSGAAIAPFPSSTTVAGLKRASKQRIAIQAIDASGNLSPRAELGARTR